MIKTAKKGLALVMALVLCLSLLTGIIPKAQAATYTYNWGAREDTATTADFTRSTAEEWYAKYSTSYEELAQLSGSKTQSSVPSSALYQELKSLMTKAHTTTTSYDGTKSMYQYTDCQNGGGKISSFYSGKEIGPAWGQGDWNREHTWPKSKSLNGNSNGGSDESDIMMLRPTSTSENSSRGNTAYGEYYYDPNEESGGKHNLHGDVARICLYVYVRWGNTQYMWGASGVMESRYTLLKWMEEDPVDTWELGRNDAVQSITGTRNVFVDYPELAFILFGEDVPAGYTSPSGSGNVTAYNITATSNNTSYGTVSLNGKTITASPKTGYYASGYTVTSGSAQVIQNGNTFQVIPSSDCTIRINFAAKTSVQVQFSENGVTAKTVNAYAGDSLTLPSNTNSAPAGYTFLGWMDTPLEETTQKPTFKTAGTAVSATNKTYYALYTYAVGGTGVTSYTKTDIADIKPGDAFVITMTKGSTIYALPNTAASTGPTPATVTAADGKLTGDVAGSLLWNLGGSANAWEFYPNGETSRWLSCTNDNNGVRVDTGSNKTFKVSGTYLFNNGTSRYLGVYETKPDWRCYTNSSTNIGGQTLAFYVKGESGIAYYTSGVTGEADCYHEDSYEVMGQEPTCTAVGYTAGFYCNDCESYLSGHEEIPALGHAWGSWEETTAPTCTAAGEETAICSRCDDETTRVVAATGHSYAGVVTPPTTTQQGYTTFTCGTCGHSYVGDYTEALGETFVVTFKVPNGVAAVAPMTCGKTGITLPAATAPTGYTFLGWSAETISDTEEMPEILKGSYTATADVTLHAVYSYVETEGDQASGVYSLYTGALTEGDYVIYYKTDALKATETGSDRISAQTTTVTNDTIADPDALIVWHIAPTDDGNWTIYNAEKNVYTASNGTKNKGKLISSLTENAKWSVEGADTYEFTNVANKAKGVNALLRWNSTSIGWATYSGSTGGRVSLYKAQTGTTYYTTLECEHDYEAVVTPPTTEAGGYTTHTCTICGDSYVDNYTDPLPEVTLTITAQPESVMAEVGATVTFSVTAEGAVSYKWQYKNASATSWSNTSLTGYNTDTLTVANLVGSTHNGRQYRCIITDANGNTVTSDPATLTVIYLVNDAKTQGVQIGETAFFTVKHSDPGATYRWQYKGNTAASTWANTSATGNKTDTLQVVAKATNNRYMYRCNITLSDGTVITSKEVYLNVVEDPAVVTANPVDTSVVSGDKAYFEIEAEGDGLVYQWQWSNDGVSWANTKSTGYSTPKLTVKTNNFMSGRYYRCVVKTYNGTGWNRTYTEAAQLTVLPAADILETLPETVTVKVGENAQLHIGADGEGLTYQWQWAKFKGNWKNTSMTGATTDTLIVPGSLDYNGRYYRVVITNAYGGYIETAAVQLFVEE